MFTVAAAKCKEKWRNIRTVFSRRLKPGPSGSKRKKPYYLQDILQFLVPFLKPSVSEVTGNLPPVPVHDIEDAPQPDDDADEDEVGSQSDAPSSAQSQSTPQPAKLLSKTTTSATVKRKRRHQEMSEADKTFIDFCKRQNTIAVETPRKHFLLSHLSDLESMTQQQGGASS